MVAAAAAKGRLWVSERLHALFEAELEELANDGARKRRVLDFFLVPGKVQAKVQDEQGKLHRIEIMFKQFSEAEWQVACGVLASQALFLAGFLVSRLPEEITNALAHGGISLVPNERGDIELLSDGEHASGRKHLNALFVLEKLLDRLDEDPFSILLLRGKGREELMLEIRRRRSALEPPTESGWAHAGEIDEEKKEAPVDHERFWRSGTAMNKLSYSIRADELPASVLKRLDTIPLGGLEESVEPFLEEAYALVARRAQAYGLDLQE